MRNIKVAGERYFEFYFTNTGFLYSIIRSGSTADFDSRIYESYTKPVYDLFTILSGPVFPQKRWNLRNSNHQCSAEDPKVGFQP